ncbi:hypothetical protein RU98_GL001925 [Enterococcus caccae]|nr:hypothetical protein RU98_GL001925 [Enterococcus caccae]
MIAKEFCDTHSEQNFRLITKENGGQSSARNIGMKEANGIYIVFIDSDDLVSNTYVEMLYSAVNEKKAKLAMCKMTKNLSELSNKLDSPAEYLVGDFLTLVDTLYASKYPSASANAKIYHHSLIKSTRFYEGIIYEDGLFFYEIINQVDGIILIDVASYYYRTSENSTMTSGITRKNFDILKQNELVYNLFEKNHPEAYQHFYRKALNANDYTAVKCVEEKTKLSKELLRELYNQNKKYSKKIFPRKLIYLSWWGYFSVVFIISKFYSTKKTDKELYVKKLIKKVTS